jgi:hypothetical protein
MAPFILFVEQFWRLSICFRDVYLMPRNSHASILGDYWCGAMAMRLGKGTLLVILDEFRFSSKSYSRRFNFHYSATNNLFQNRYIDFDDVDWINWCVSTTLVLCKSTFCIAISLHCFRLCALTQLVCSHYPCPLQIQLLLLRSINPIPFFLNWQIKRIRIMIQRSKIVNFQKLTVYYPS